MGCYEKTSIYCTCYDEINWACFVCQKIWVLDLTEEENWEFRLKYTQLI